MHIAAHLIKVKGTFDKKLWTEEALKEYVNNKIKEEIFVTFHADLELFRIVKNNIDIWVYISCLPSEVDKSIIVRWLKEHITDNGLRVTWFGIESDMGNDFSVLLE